MILDYVRIVKNVKFVNYYNLRKYFSNDINLLFPNELIFSRLKFSEIPESESKYTLGYGVFQG